MFAKKTGLASREYFNTRRSLSTIDKKNEFEENCASFRGDLEIEDLKYAFESFDIANRGYLNVHALKMCLRALNYDVGKKNIRQILHSSDDVVTFDGFVTICNELGRSMDPIQEFRNAFKLFDTSNTGAIGIDDLRVIADLIGESCTDSQLAQMIDEFDLDGDGKINEDEFIRIMRMADGDL